MVRLKLADEKDIKFDIGMFQFLYGTIKIGSAYLAFFSKKKFQFLYGTIKIYNPNP